jgi:hypothetical protein
LLRGIGSEYADAITDPEGETATPFVREYMKTCARFGLCIGKILTPKIPE